MWSWEGFREATQVAKEGPGNLWEASGRAERPGPCIFSFSLDFLGQVGVERAIGGTLWTNGDIGG